MSQYKLDKTQGWLTDLANHWRMPDKVLEGMAGGKECIASTVVYPVRAGNASTCGNKQISSWGKYVQVVCLYVRLIANMRMERVCTHNSVECRNEDGRCKRE